MNHTFSGADWLARTYPKMEISPLGRQVAEILGFIFRGLYHLDGLKKVNWADTHCITVDIRRSLSTYDFADLTALVVVCHDECVRLEISPHTFNLMRLMFHPRKREGGIGERHPTLEAHVEGIRKGYSIPQPEGA